MLKRSVRGSQRRSDPSVPKLPVTPPVQAFPSWQDVSRLFVEKKWH